MGEKITEQLKLLAQAQECVGNATDIINQWESVQRNVEQATFDVINISDLAIRLAKQGNDLILSLQKQYEKMIMYPDLEHQKEMKKLIGDTTEILHQIRDVALTTSSTAHNLEKEVIAQREVVKNMLHTIEHIGGSVNETVACTEFYDLLELHTQREAWTN